MNDQSISGGICAPQGFEAGSTACGIKESGELDLCILASKDICAAAGTFTRNAFRAAPVKVTMEHLQKDGRLQAVVVNSGNANSWTGEQGMEDARAMAVLTAEEIGAHPWDVAVASTGAIGHYLPMKKVMKGIDEAASGLSKGGHNMAAKAIMTTDTCAKEAALDYGDFRVGGMAKGAGMIHPNMATMLAFVTTDAEVEPGELSRALREAVEVTFNLITVDGGTSTNDMVLAMASGASGKKLNAGEIEGPLYNLCSMLARSLVEDGEGATRFITVRLHEAVDEKEAKRAAMAVASSPLVKTAAFGGDPNWGRVIYALGSAFEELDPEGVRVVIGGLKVAEAGAPVEVDEKELQQAVAGDEIEFDIYLGRGQAAVEVWTCDLSYDYVKINAEYHT